MTVQKTYLILCCFLLVSTVKGSNVICEPDGEIGQCYKNCFDAKYEPHFCERCCSTPAENEDEDGPNNNKPNNDGPNIDGPDSKKPNTTVPSNEKPNNNEPNNTDRPDSNDDPNYDGPDDDRPDSNEPEFIEVIIDCSPMRNGCPPEECVFCPETEAMRWAQDGCSSNKCRPDQLPVSPNNRTCVPITECPPFNCNRPNEKYVPCFYSTPCSFENCTDLLDPPCIMDIDIYDDLLEMECEPMCRCIDGYYRKDGICVPSYECEFSLVGPA